LNVSPPTVFEIDAKNLENSVFSVPLVWRYSGGKPCDINVNYTPLLH